ncbi:hypothetical protein LEP1GSC179_3356 [Leptospira santarosai str. MOR084]|uniref:Uncharacterized protein n=1 Tax=Leptospira santarosai str. MOR084 TaxID=1049984 RepID=A0A0E2BI24_9LEPT|nr:hypothetical protein LEP1GSC179_3356 [Leptospira santarosai str. MOR084]
MKLLSFKVMRSTIRNEFENENKSRQKRVTFSELGWILSGGKIY